MKDAAEKLKIALAFLKVSTPRSKLHILLISEVQEKVNAPTASGQLKVFKLQCKIYFININR